MNIFQEEEKQLATISFRLKKSEKELIQLYAEEHGFKNITEFIKFLIKNEMQK